ncbi:MAG: ABC-type transport auxiliary lipoprotein family protein [Pseudomonadota bacterium]
MRKLACVLFGLSVLASCGAPAERYAVNPPAVTQNQRIIFGAVELREVSLPAYAASDEIALRDATGLVSSEGAVLWADTPDRAIALELSRHLVQITRARVASSPWPFETPPDARVDLRFETLIAGADGRYHATGQYFVAVSDGGRERSGLFDLSVPFDPEAGPPAIAAARGQIILDLAEFLARDGLR